LSCLQKIQQRFQPTISSCRELYSCRGFGPDVMRLRFVYDSPSFV